MKSTGVWTDNTPIQKSGSHCLQLGVNNDLHKVVADDTDEYIREYWIAVARNRNNKLMLRPGHDIVLLKHRTSHNSVYIGTVNKTCFNV